MASLALLHRQRACQMVLIDPKSRGLAPFANFPHLLRPLVTDTTAAGAALTDLVGEMEQRDRTGVSSPPIIVVIDELADLLMTGGREVEQPLTRLLQRGRGAGIHVVAATQKPSASALNPLIRSNFPMRIVGRVVSAGDALMAAGVGGTNAERLTGRGDMLAVTQGCATRFQGAYIDEAQIAQLSGWLNAGAAGRGGVLTLQRPTALVRAS